MLLSLFYIPLVVIVAHVSSQALDILCDIRLDLAIAKERIAIGIAVSNVIVF